MFSRVFVCPGEVLSYPLGTDFLWQQTFPPEETWDQTGSDIIPLEPQRRVIHILLECFLVISNNTAWFFVIKKFIYFHTNSGLSLLSRRMHIIGITNEKRQRFYLQMVIDIMEKNDGLERCLEDDFICSVQNGDDDDYLKKYVAL